jgi:hypothetical protein
MTPAIRAEQLYSDAKERLGMTPSAWRNGGSGETIRWTHFESPLGRMLIAATGKGICRLTFDDSEASLKRLFPNAAIVEDSGGLRELVEGALAAIQSPLAARELPIDVAALLSRKPCGASSGRSRRAKRAAMPRLRRDRPGQRPSAPWVRPMATTMSRC